MPYAIYCWQPGTIWWTGFFYLAGYGVDDFADDGSIIFCIPGYYVGHDSICGSVRISWSELNNISTYSFATPKSETETFVKWNRD